MSRQLVDLTNAERQARHRVRVKERLERLESEVTALRAENQRLIRQVKRLSAGKPK
jgi:hypothetical protein